MSKSENIIPFTRTITFKLFATYCLVVLVTILTTLAIHFLSVRHHMAAVFEQESLSLAGELKPEAEKYLAEGQSQSLENFLKFAQASARYGVNFVSFETGREDSQPSFLLTEEEKTKVSSGENIDGSAADRIDPELFQALPPPRRSPRARRWNGRKKGRHKTEKRARRMRPPGRRGAKSNQSAPNCPPGMSVPEPHLFLAVPLSLDGAVVGALVIYDTKPSVSRRSKMMLRTAVNGMLIALFPALLCALFLARNLTRPIRRMEAVAQEYTSGHFTTRTNLRREDELGVLARAFDNMASELEESVATRERLLSDVSHELGTPVTTIRATLEAILDRLVEPEQNDFYLQSSLNELEHLSRIVKDITELSRFETGDIRLDQDVFLAEKPVQQSVESALILAQRKNIRVEISESDSRLLALGDLLRITQVLKNLVMNAVQHNPEGTIVNASWKEEEDRVHFTVADNGPQIGETDSRRIFERFYKVSESRTRDDSSSGLGLAIVSRILLAHDTEIQFQNTSEGKFFSFSLPKA